MMPHLARRRLRDEERDPSFGLGLVFLVRRIGGDGELPQPRPLRLVSDLADPHRLYLRMIAKLDGGVGAQVVHPDRVRGRSAHRADEDVARTVLDAHQRCLANRAGLVAGVRHDDHRQPGVTKRGAFPAVEIRDLTELQTMRVREVNDAAERARLWKLAVAAFPPYEEYQAKTTRRIPVFIAEPKG